MGRGEGVSEAYRCYRRVFFEERHRDGPSVPVLDALSPAERRLAEQELLAELTERKSYDAVRGLAHLRSRPAIEPLRAIMRTGRLWWSVQAAKALWAIDADEEAFRTLCRAVADRPWVGRRFGRYDAAAALRWIDRPAALIPLIGALDDRDPLVQAHAREAVAQRLRLHAEADALRSGQMGVPEFRARAWAALTADR